MKKLRLGVVGLGHRGRHMFRLSCDSFDFLEPAAACDLKPENWYEQQWLSDAPMAQYYPNAVFYDDYRKMLDEADLDVVLVETGADIHAEFCRLALEKNIHVLSDIPTVASLEEAEMLWKTEQRSKAILSVGANPNEQKFTVMLQDFYKKGLLGEPYYMEAEYIHWSMPKSDSDIHLNENGDWRRLLCPIRYCTHSLGPLLTILKEDITRVSAFGTGAHGADYPPNGKKDDMQCAQFQTDSGVVIRLLRNGRCRAQIGHHNYRVFGTEGYMDRRDVLGKNPETIHYNSTKLDNDNELVEISGEKMPPAYKDDPKAVGHGGMDYAILDHFYTALLNNAPAPISLREGLRMTIPGIYAEESIKRGGEVLPVLYPWNENWTGKL